MKLKRQFIILLTIFIILPSMLTVFVSSFLFKDKAEELVKTNIITASTDKAGRIQAYYEQVESNLKFIKQMNPLAEFLIVNSDSNKATPEMSDKYADNRNFISNLIKKHVNESSYIISIFIANQNDTVLLCDEVSSLGQNIDYVKGISDLPEDSCVIGTVLGTKNYKDTVTTCISLPIYVDNEYYGYITAIIKPEYYETVIGLDHFFETGSVTVIAPNDTILATGSDIFKNYITNLPVDNTFINQWKSIDFENNPNEVLQYQINGVDNFGYYIYIENTGVKILSTVKATEISNNILNILFFAFGCIFVVTIFVLFISMISLNKFISPIKHLTEVTKEIRKGNENIRLPNTYKNEFGELYSEFNKLTSELLKRVHDLDETNDQMLQISNNIKAGVIKLRVDSDFQIKYVNEEFLHMLECERDNFYDRYRDKFLNTIYYQDKSRVRIQLLKKNHNSDYNEFEYRIEKTNRSFIWVSCKTKVVADAHNSLYLYGIITDITNLHNTIESLKQYEERYQIISDQTEDIICEYDYINDTIKYTPKWLSKFGYNVYDKNSYACMLEAPHVHDNDKQLFIMWLKNNYKKNTNKSTEFRMKDINDKFIWVNIRATTIFDSIDEPIKMIMIITDITSRKKQLAELTQMTQIDPLTGILNKMTAQNNIETAISIARAGDRNALIIVDIDNFKSINDKLGHLRGDNILSELADELKQIFGKEDIIGRIGGDEFIIFVKNIKSEEEIAEKANLIINLFNKSYNTKGDMFNISASIGIAKYPEHGMRFNELFKNADSALYMAKNSGKNQFAMFNEKIKGLAYTKNFEKESKALEIRQTKFKESFTEYIFSLLYETKDIKKTINMILEIVGKHYHVSRSYIFENSSDNLCCSNTYEWCNIGITEEIKTLQNIGYSEIDDHDKLFNNNGIFYCSDISTLPSNVKTILEQQNINSMLHCAMKHDGVFKGFIGFDECTGRRVWTQDEINTLNFISKIIGSFLIKSKLSNTIVDHDKIIQTVIDTKDSWVYIVNAQTMKLEYSNKKLNSLANEMVLNRHCYEFFEKKITDNGLCADCPIAKLKENPSLNKASSVTFVPKLNVTTDLSATKIIQENGDEYYLLTAKFVKDKK